MSIKSIFITDPFFGGEKPTRNTRQTFTPESFTRYRFTETGTPVLLVQPKRGPVPVFSEDQPQFNLRRDDGVKTSIRRASILAYLGTDQPEPTLPPSCIPLSGFSDYALCPANGTIFRYRSPARGVWNPESRKRIQGRKHGGKWSYGPEYFRLICDQTGKLKSLPFEKVLASAGLTTRQFAQKFKGSQFFVDGVPST